LQFIADSLSPNYTFKRTNPLLAGNLAYLKLGEVKGQIKLKGRCKKEKINI